MEKYTMFMDWKNQYSENEYTTQSNLEIKCNPYQTTNGIIHRIRANNFTICMETQKTLNSKSNLEKAGPTESVPLRTTCVPEPEWLRLGSAYNPGPASDSSWQSNLEPKQCRQGKHTRHERGQTHCG